MQYTPETREDLLSTLQPRTLLNFLSTNIGTTVNNIMVIVLRTPNRLDGMQVRIQDLFKGLPQLPKLKNCRHSRAELCKQSKLSVAGVQGLLKGPEELLGF